MFNNTGGDGYAVNPFGNLTAEEWERFGKLSLEMSRRWVAFVVGGRPVYDVDGAVEWPVYDTGSGGGEGRDVVFSASEEGSFVEVDAYRGEGIKWISDNSLGVWGM